MYQLLLHIFKDGNSVTLEKKCLTFAMNRPTHTHTHTLTRHHSHPHTPSPSLSHTQSLRTFSHSPCPSFATVCIRKTFYPKCRSVLWILIALDITAQFKTPFSFLGRYGFWHPPGLGCGCQTNHNEHLQMEHVTNRFLYFDFSGAHDVTFHIRKYDLLPGRAYFEVKCK